MMFWFSSEFLIEVTGFPFILEARAFSALIPYCSAISLVANNLKRFLTVESERKLSQQKSISFSVWLRYDEAHAAFNAILLRIISLESIFSIAFSPIFSIWEYP